MEVVFGSGSTTLTGQISDGICVRQSFIAAGRRLNSVSILLSTYRQLNTGRVVVEILNTKNHPIAASTANAGELLDNKYRRFLIGASLKVGERYNLRIKTLQSRQGSAPTAHYAKSSRNESLFIGSRNIKGEELTCRFDYELIEAIVHESSPIKATGMDIDSNSIPGLVSVVVPHYNCPDLLGKCLLSLTKQTYNGIEVIVVDDGSAEGIHGLLSIFRLLIPGLQGVFHPQNSGAPAARNTGASKAHGEYLLFVDADCEMYPTSIQVMLETLMAYPNAAYAYGGFRWGPETIAPRPFDAETLRQRNYITTMSMMRRSMFPGFDVSLRRHQDWDLWLTILERGGVGVCTGKMLFETPRRAGSISSDENIGLKTSVSIVKAKHGLP